MQRQNHSIDELNAVTMALSSAKSMLYIAMDSDIENHQQSTVQDYFATVSSLLERAEEHCVRLSQALAMK